MRWSRPVVVLALVVAAALVLPRVPHDPQALRDAVAAAGVWAPLLLLGAWVVGTPLLVPGTLLCAAAGLLLGPAGVAVSLVGSPLGALAGFAVGRLIGRGRLADRLPARLQGAVARLERSGVRGVTLLRMAPGMPVAALNYACGASRLRAWPFFAGSALGAAPRVVLYGALGGAAAQAGPIVALAGAAAVAAAGLVVLVRRRLLAGAAAPA